MVDYPYEWNKYMVDGKVRTFEKNTPGEIIIQAKIINEQWKEITDKDFFYFEAEQK